MPSIARFLLLLVLICPCIPALALGVKTSEFTLSNGMKVVVIPDHRTQIVTHSVWYRVGAADEISGKTGLAHFLEHLMFKGTRKFPYGQFDRLLDVNGAEGNAFTTQDHTMYFQRTTADRLPLMMELEADRMQNLVLTDDIVKPELDVVREERRQRTENNPGALLGEQLDAAMFTAHPYGRPIVGWMSEVSKLTREDALAFYRQYYTPANAVLVVAGDVDVTQTLGLAERTYGQLKNTVTPTERIRTPEPTPIVARRITMTDPRASSPYVMRSYLAPSYVGKTKSEALALDFFATVLGSGTESRLHQELVLKQKLATYAGSYFDGSARDYGRLTLYLVPNDGVDLAALEAAADKVIAEALDKGISQAELDRTRKQALAEMIYSLDSQMSLVNAAGASVVNGESAASAFNTDDWQNVTPEAAMAAARAYIKPERSVTAIMLLPAQAGGQ